ncbi:MAG TPA: diphthine synthase [archaeon]|nr:diphthine synthase [archaeon]
MLYLISLGLSDEKDMSLKALEAAKKCGKLYAEFYTTKMNTTTRKLSELIGKDVVELQRADIEDHSIKIINQAKTMDIGILIGGDALSATTHISLLLDAKKSGVKTKVTHGSSIFSAVAETGLQLYKFGAATSLARPAGKYFPDSFYDIILKNKKIGLHTLVLLDIGMSVHEAAEILLEIEKKRKAGISTHKTKIAACSQLGSDNQIIKYNSIENLLADENFTRYPAILVFPGDLHFLEEEFLNNL